MMDRNVSTGLQLLGVSAVLALVGLTADSAMADFFGALRLLVALVGLGSIAHGIIPGGRDSTSN